MAESIISQFVPHRSQDEQARIRHVENYLVELSQAALNLSSSGGGGGGTIGLPIPESEVSFEASEGHNHDGVNSTPVPMEGDVTGTNIASVVEKARGIPLPIPTSLDEHQFLMYNDTTLSYELQNPRVKTVTKFADYTLTLNETIVLADATAGNMSITLPTAVGVKDVVFMVKKIDSSAFTVTVVPASLETIDGQVNFPLVTQYSTLAIVSDNVNWFGI
jgi:hypothetical protein